VVKSEAEIKAKLLYYQGILAGFEAAHNIDKVSVFLALERLFPGEGQATLTLSTKMEEAIGKLPPEDQSGIKETFGGYPRDVQLFLENRIAILKWVLGESDAEGDT